MATFSRDTVYAPLRLPRFYNLVQRLVGGGRDRAAFVRTHVAFRSDEKVVVQVAAQVEHSSFCLW